MRIDCLQILNNSLMTVSFLWSHEETEQCEVTMCPSEGSIGNVVCSNIFDSLSLSLSLF